MLRVRSRVIGGWLLAGGLLATAVVGACADKKGALMLAITTDMKAPKDVNAVAVSITTNGLVKASFIGRVTPQGDILLPGTLAIVEPDDKNAVIRIRVMAFQNQKPRVIRDVRTTAPPNGRTALLRIPLNFVNDGKVAGNDLPNGLVPDPVPGTENLSPPASSTSSSTPAADSGAGAVGTKDLSPSGGDFDFMLNFQPKDCPNPQDDTIINGECHDSYIDPASLPDFDAAELGDSTGQTGACFDLAKCFAGAVDTGQGAGGNDGGTGPVDAGSGGADSSAPALDAGPKPFKDFRPAAVVFDSNTCTIQLNGADPARLNIAIVTPDTGECVRAGECYVPLDRGAAGWQDDGAGRVQLPSYLCKFLTAKGLHLATSSDVCAAKLESNPICTPKAGDDAGIVPVPDAGGPNAVFGIPEDFASAVTLFGPTLFFGSQSRQGFVDVTNPSAKPQPITGIATPGSARLPWRFGVGPGGVALANGTTTGYLLGPQGQSQPITFTAPIIDVAALDVRFTWASMQASQLPSFFIAPPLPVFQAEIQVPVVTAVAATPFKDHILVGDGTGVVQLCKPELMQCGEPSVANGARVDSMVINSPTGGYALTGNGIYSVTVDGTAGTTSTRSVVADVASFAGIVDGASYFPHGVAASGSCLVYSSAKGLEYFVEKSAGTISPPQTLVAAKANQPILGVAIGPDPTGGAAAYYTVFAQRDPAGGNSAGGIYRVKLPMECAGAGAPDGGTATDAGADAGPVCGPANCPGCCNLGACIVNTGNTACGLAGTVCNDCTKGALVTCNIANGTCM
jgi:hypothetical protein